jgi:hypothetical protein
VSDWLALRTPLAIAGLIGVALLVLWGLVVTGNDLFVVPPPEQESDGAARHTLTADLREQVTEADLRALARELEQARPRVEDANGVAAVVQSGTATATVEVRMEDGRRRHVQFSLEREKGLWKLRSVDPARALSRGAGRLP